MYKTNLNENFKANRSFLWFLQFNEWDFRFNKIFLQTKWFLQFTAQFSFFSNSNTEPLEP
jgi:hypothetical protein